MSAYTSIFEQPVIITKRNLCEILNLDTARPGLEFTPAEIKKAYRLRTLRIHPDKQINYQTQIPRKICDALMNDCALARDYLLRGEDNILGKGFQTRRKNANQTAAAGGFVNSVIKVLKNIKAGSSTIGNTVPWISRLSNSLSIAIIFSTFSEGELNFRYVNAFPKQMAMIRPFLAMVDYHLLAALLRKIKSGLESAEKLNIEEIVNELKAILPKDSLTDSQAAELTVALEEASGALKDLLTDAFINHMDHIMGFWFNFLLKTPTWGNIIGVTFISLLFSSTSLPKFFSAVKNITEVITQHKHPLGIALLALPMATLAITSLPLNIVITLGTRFTWILSKAAVEVIGNSILLALNAIILAAKLISSIVTRTLTIKEPLFAIFENTLNLTLRLVFNIVIEALDNVIFLFTNKSFLSSLQESFNYFLDSMLDKFRPDAKTKANNSAEPNTDKQVVLATDAQRPAPTTDQAETPQQQGFFRQPNIRLHNVEDKWLNDLLAKLQPAANASQAPAHANQTDAAYHPQANLFQTPNQNSGATPPTSPRPKQ